MCTGAKVWVYVRLQLNVHKYLAMSVPLRVCACMAVHKCPGMCVCLYRTVFIYTHVQV